MSEQDHTPAPTAGSYRIRRVKDGQTQFFGGHHPSNGRVDWVESDTDAVHYPSEGAASTVMDAIRPDEVVPLDVTRID